MSNKNSRYLVLTLIFAIISSNLMIAVTIPTANAVGSSIYIYADGSIKPDGAPITHDAANTTYTLTSAISDQIVIQRDNILFDGNGLTLSDFSTSTTSQAITVQLAHGVRITNAVISGYAYGIYIEYSNFTTVDSCIVQQTRKAGIFYYRSSYGSIHDNMVFSSQYDGLMLWQSTNNVLRNNVLFSNGYNFNLIGAYRSEIVNDIDTSNTVDSKPIYFWVDQTGGTIPLNAGYVALISCTGINVQNLTLTKNSEGIRLCETNSSYIAYNNITGNVYGILAQRGSSGNTVFRNQIVDNGNKPDLYTGTLYGYGISLLNGADLNIIYENNLTSNQVGIDIYYSSTNTLFHNTFKNPTQVEYTSGANVWDDGSEGNYWSDYTGIDANSDGIGDTPRVLSADNQDEHPLMGAFYTFQADLFGVKREVNVISNSDIKSFSFFAENNTIKMQVTNSSAGQIFGFQRATIPKALMTPPYRAIFNQGLGQITSSNYTLADNGTARWVYYAYNHTITKPDQILLTSKYYIVFIPMNLTGTLASYQAEAKSQYDFLAKSVPILLNCSEPIIMNQTLTLNFDKDDPDKFDGFAEIAKFATTRNVTGDRYIALSDAHFWENPTTHDSVCDGLSNSGNTVLVKFGISHVTTHELGHSWGLEDEYSYSAWLAQSKSDFGYPAGFPPNSYPGDDPILLAINITGSSFGRSFGGKNCIMGPSNTAFLNGTIIDHAFCPAHTNQTSAGLHDFEGCTDHVSVAITNEAMGYSKGMAASTVVFFANGSTPVVKELQYLDIYGKPMSTSLNSNYSMQVYSGTELLYSSNVPASFWLRPSHAINETSVQPVQKDSVTVYWLMPIYEKDQISITITDNVLNKVLSTYSLNKNQPANAVLKLNSTQDISSTNNLGTISIGNSQYLLPNQVLNQTGTFQIQYSPTGVYSFKSWQVSGNITLSNANTNPTSATINGSATITAFYEDKTLYTVGLESKENSTLNSNLGTILVNGTTYNLPDSTNLLRGFYTVSYEPIEPYGFIKWETTGNIKISDQNSRQAILNVTGSGTLRAIYKVGTVHNLNTSKTFATIQSAINDYATLNGHTILVDAGIYREQIAVNKSLTLRGQVPTVTNIIGKFDTDVIVVNANHVTITGFNISQEAVGGYEYSISLSSSNYTTITGNIITKARGGVYLSKSFFCTVTQNNFTNMIAAYSYSPYVVRQTGSAAIVNSYSSNNIFSNNSISYVGYGVNFIFSNNCSVTNNMVLNCSSGYGSLGASDSLNLVYENNSIVNGLGDAIRMSNVTTSRFVNNSIDTVANWGQSFSANGMYMIGLKNSKIINNTLTNVWGYGIVLGQGSIFSVTPTGNQIIRNNITNCRSGVMLNNAAANFLSNNYIFNTISNGVYVGAYTGYGYAPSSNNTLHMNIIDRTGMGLSIVSTSSSIITNNTVTNSLSNGILVQECTYLTLRNNTMSFNKYNFGIHATTTGAGLSWSEYWFTSLDIDTSNTVDGKPIYYWTNRITPQTVPSNAGYVGLAGCRYITIANLTLTNNWQGILLAGTANSTIKDNTITTNHEGLSVYANSNYNLITNNSVTQNPWYGIHLVGSSYNNIIQNNVTYNGVLSPDPYIGTVGAGISIGCAPPLSYRADNNTVQANNITQNTFGVYIGLYPNNRISWTIPLANNKIIANNIFYNDNGTYIDGATKNVVYSNHFLGNNRQAYTNALNTWDNGYPAGGNYWSDYTGLDLYSGPYQNITGSDGIGDTPYSVGSSINYIDMYPILGYVPPQPQYFTLNIQPITGGVTSPSAGNYSYQDGFTLLVNATASSGYQFSNWVLDGQNASSTYQLSITMNANHTLQAVFTLIPVSQVTLTISTTTGGTTDPTPQIYTYEIGSSQMVNALANSTYHFTYWLLDGQSFTSNPINVNMNTNHTLQAVFAINHFIINASANAGGTISPSGTIILDYGQSQVFTVTPSTGYHVSSVLIDGTPTTEPYSISNISANHTIVANFAINQYTITVTQTNHGTITPNTTIKDYGADQTFSISPDVGYHIANVIVDGNPIGQNASVTFNDITANHTLTATYEQALFNIQASAGPGGTISPNGNVSVVAGADQDFIIVPNTGYHITTVLVDDVPVNLPYNFTNVAANHMIAASFAIDDRALVTFKQSGLDNAAASGIILTVNGTSVVYSGFDYSIWVGSGDSLIYSFNSTVASTASDKRFILTNQSTTSPLVGILSATTVTGSYEVQYKVLFDVSSNVKSDSLTAILTSNGTAKSGSALPYSVWVTNGDGIAFAYSSPVASIADKFNSQYIWYSTSGLGQTFQANSFTVSKAGTITATYSKRSLTYTGATSGVYSDPAIISATFIDSITGPVSGKRIDFNLGTQSGYGITDSSGVASTMIYLTQPAGNYSVKAMIVGASVLTTLNDVKVFQVSKEDVTVTYEGDILVTTTTSATVNFTALLTQPIDEGLGDLTRANVTFELFKSGNFGSVPDYKFNVSTNSEGKATLLVNVPFDVYVLEVRLCPENNTYWKQTNVPILTLTVTMSTKGSTNGGGWIQDNGSANGKGNFGFSVQYAKNAGTKGNFVYVYRNIADRYTYVVKSNSWSISGGGLTFTADNKATFSGKCVIQVIDSDGNLITSYGNSRFSVSVTDVDMGLPQSKGTDTICISFVTQDGTTINRNLASSAGAQVPIYGGNINVRKD